MANTWYAQLSANFNANSNGVSSVWYSTSSGSGGSWLNWNPASQTINDVITSGDTFIANSYTIALNIDITVACNMQPHGTLGGSFTISGNINISASFTAAATKALSISSGTVSITGNITGGSSANTYGVHLTGNCSLTVTGNVTSGSAGVNAYGIYIDTNVTASLVINGQVTGTSSAHGVVSGGTGSTITVNKVGSTAVQAGLTKYGLYNTDNSANITINGNILGGSGSGGAGLVNAGNNAVITIRGNINGGGAPTAYGVYCNTSSFATHLTIYGNVKAGMGTGLNLGGTAYFAEIRDGQVGDSTIGTSSAVSISGTGTLNVYGNVYPANSSSGINISGSTNAITIYGNVYGGTAGQIGSHGVSFSMFPNTLTVYGDVIAQSTYCYAINAATLPNITITVQGNVDYTSGTTIIGLFKLVPTAAGSNVVRFPVLRDGSTANENFTFQLPAIQVLKGIVHGTIKGLLAPASPFRRIKKRYV